MLFLLGVIVLMLAVAVMIDLRAEPTLRSKRKVKVSKSKRRG
jgi:hypothetical protein